MNPSSRLRLIAAGTIGNVLEWYDFAVYGYFAISIGQTFFPQHDPVTQALAAFGVLAVGYLTRPLGGMLTGYIGDRYSKRAALIFSVTSMAGATFLIGLLPGYDTLGLAAPVLLTLLRMMQGLSVGGEFTTGFIFMIERADPSRRGFISGVGCASTILGNLLGSGAGAVMAALLAADQLHDWGWRVPFMLGLVVGVVGYVLRRDLEDAHLPERTRAPIRQTFSHHKRLLLRIAGLVAFAAVSFFLTFLYIVSWLQTVDGVAPDRALTINTTSLGALILVELAAGWLSDRIGRKPLLIAAHVLGFVTAVPLLWLMHHPATALIVLGQLGFVLVGGLAVASMPALLVENTPAEVRCTAISVGFNLSYGVLGGLTPLAAAWLVDRTSIDLSPAYLIMAAAVISLASVLGLKETAPTRTGGVDVLRKQAVGPA
jgi:MHS family proline/betaine transporter-like MFS transporter